MMKRICLAISVVMLFAMSALAQDSLAVAQDSLSVVKDTLAVVEDTSAVTPVKPARPASPGQENYGDASKYIKIGRAQAKAKMPFNSKAFKDNLFVGAVGVTRVPYSSDYGFTYSAGASATKWLIPSVGMRADLMGGYMNSNLTGERVSELALGVSALFNVSSYIAGYDKRRFCELSTVMGVGYMCRWDVMTEHYFTGNVGVNVNLRLSDRFSLYLEPYLPLHFNSAGLSYGFATQMGVYYDLSTSVVDPEIAGKYFVTFTGGVQLQNSELVKRAEQDYNTTGMSFTLGAGRRFGDYWAVRLSGVFSRHTWTVYYGAQKMPANYFAFRLEGMFDALSLILDKCNVKNVPVGCGVVLGPEAGCMVKQDLGSTLTKHYVGLTSALHIDWKFGKRYAIFVEPRMSFLPYSAPHDQSTVNNVNRNYYDGLFNFNFGMEIDL